MSLEEQLSKRVFVVAIAAAFSHQHDDHGPCVIIESDPKELMALHLRSLPALPPTDAPVFGWRVPTFALRPGVNVGTIDELTALYRQSLINAATSMMASSALGAYVDVDKSVANARALGYVPGQGLLTYPLYVGHPLTLPWLERATKDTRTLVERHREQEGSV